MVLQSNLEEAADVAEALVKARGVQAPPVNVEEILRSEPVKLCPDDYGNAFDGRLEYDAPSSSFLLFYNTYGMSHPVGRTRFSIGHEAGHYFLKRHRSYLQNGGTPHESKAGFVANQDIEREADTFAANLLIPRYLVAPRLQDPNLRDIKALAQEFGTSLLAAAIRTTQVTSRSCTLIVSTHSRVDYVFHSEDMKARRVLYVPRGAFLPACTASRKAAEMGLEGRESDIVEMESWGSIWTESRSGEDYRLWEEALYLPTYDRTLTFLTWNDEERIEGDDL